MVGIALFIKRLKVNHCHTATATPPTTPALIAPTVTPAMIPVAPAVPSAL